VHSNVDTLVGKIIEKLEASKVNGETEHAVPESLKQDEGLVDVSIGSPHMATPLPCSTSPKEDAAPYIDLVAAIPKVVSPVIQNESSNERVSTQVVGQKKVSKRRKRTTSFPPGAGRSLVSGPWSMEWLRDQVHGDVGIISSSRRKDKQAVVSKKAKQSEGVTKSKRKKVGGVLRNSIHSLKKVARLPYNDRTAVLHDLNWWIRKRQGKAGVTRYVEIVSKIVSEGGNCFIIYLL